MREIGGDGIVVGLDEVGRGALAGPLTVAAIALPDTPEIVGLDDSKKLSSKRREELFVQIEATALGKGIAHIQPDEIDACGMAACLRVAFSRVLSTCMADLEAHVRNAQISAVLVDGRPQGISSVEKAVVKGDSKCACIAAASIYAKVTRDALMVEFAGEYPEYGFASNKGYGSAAHIDAIGRIGPCSIHRLTFLGNICGSC